MSKNVSPFVAAAERSIFFISLLDFLSNDEVLYFQSQSLKYHKLALKRTQTCWGSGLKWENRLLGFDLKIAKQKQFIVHITEEQESD